MDTAIAIVIIVIAGYFVFTKVSNQLRSKRGGGCGCGSDCSSGGCCQDKDGECTTENKGD